MATATPVWTDIVSVIATATLAAGNKTRGTLDLRSKFGAMLFLRLGRKGATAPASSIQAQIRRVLNNDAAGGIHPGAPIPLAGSTSTGQATTVNSDSASGQNVLNVASVTNFAAGDLICIYDASFNRLEFHREGVRVLPLRTSERGRRLLDECLLIAGTGPRRRAADTLAGQDSGCRRGDSGVLDTIAARVAMVPRFENAIHRGDVAGLATLMRRDSALKRRIVDGIYGDGVDEALENACRAGALAGRLLGAGGSGYLLLLTPPGARERVRRAFADQVEHVRPVAPARAGVHVTEVSR